MAWLIRKHTLAKKRYAARLSCVALALLLSLDCMAQGTGSGSRGGGQLGQGPPTTSAPPIQPTLPGLGSAAAADDDGAHTARMEANQEKARNNDRQKKIVEDTQRLVALANELKVVVDKSNKDTLSLEVIKKADEIEKLARSVRDRMKGS